MQPAPTPSPRTKGKGEAFLWGLFLSLLGVIIVGTMSKQYREDVSPVWTAVLGMFCSFIFWPVVMVCFVTSAAGG